MLNARAQENAIFVIDAFGWEAPRTRTLVGLLERVGVADQKVLVLTDGLKTNVYLSGRNVPNVHVMPYSDVSTFHVLWSDAVLVESAALGTALEPRAEKQLDKVKVVKQKKEVRSPESEESGGEGEEPQAKTAKKSVKAAAKKAPAKAEKTHARKPAKGTAKKSAKTTSSASAKKPAPKKKGK